MRYIRWEEFWWNNITGARTVVDRVVTALLENKMVALQVPTDLPWRYSMRSAIQGAFNERADTREVVIETIDAVDNNPTNLEPGRFILQQYASSAVKAGFREKAGKSIQDYITDGNVIRNRILWVKGLDGKHAGNWIQFCRGFSPRSAADGLFVLEVHGDVPFVASRYIQYIDFDNSVSSYDVHQFNSFILNEDGRKSETVEWKRYISAVAAAVCGVDAEVSEMLIRLTDFRVETAIDGLRRIDSQGDFKRRGADKESNHSLWHIRNNNLSELQHRIWTAQIQVLFPIIELERQRMNEKWYDAIKTALDTQSIVQFGTTLTDPAEVELGTLCYMMSHKIGSHRLLYIPDEADRNRIKLLHGCRNDLAHKNCCTPDEIVSLLG